MEKFYGFGRKYVEEYHRKTGRALFLHLRRIKRAIGKSKENAPEENAVAQPPAEKVNHESFLIRFSGYNCNVYVEETEKWTINFIP